MANLINVIIDLKENLTAKMGEFKGSLAGAVLQGNLMSSALTGAFQVATSAVGAFTDALSNAIDTQQTIIMTSGSMASILGTTFEQGNDFVLEMNSRLAVLAGSLPGVTAEYTAFANGIVDDLGLVNKEANNGFIDMESFNEDIDLVTSKFQILSQQPGLSKAQSMGAFQSILGGRDLGQLEKLEFFRANPSFINALKQVEEGMGKSFEEMTKPERLEGLIEALNTSITDETLGKLTESLGSQIEGLKTNLLDPQVGLFGLMRDTNTTIEGQQSVLEALTATAKVLFGADNSLFATISDLFQVLGLSTDPMANLYGFILNVNQEIIGLSTVIRRISSFLGNSSDIGSMPGFIQDNIGGLISEYSNRFISQADILIPRIFRAIYDGVAIGVDFLLLAATSINWTGLAGTLANSLGSALTYALAPENLGSTLKIAGLAAAVLVAPLVLPAIAAVFAGIPLAAAAITIGVIAAYRQNWDSVTLGISSMWGEFTAGIIAKIQFLSGSMSGKVEGIKLEIVSFFGQFGEMWRNLAETVLNAMGKITQIGSSIASVPSNPMNIVQQGAAIGARLLGGGRAEGNIPNAADGFLPGLLSAVGRESRAMPSGSQVVVANTSEMILNRAQQAMMGRSQPTFVPGNLNIGNINLAASPGLTPEQTADRVMQLVAQRFETWKSSQLSSVVS